MHACRSKPTTITLVFFIAQINQAMESRMLLLSILGLSLVLSSAGSSTAARAPVPIDPAYKDPNRTIHARLKSLMGQMTLEEKIGQMAQLERGVATPEILRDYSIGSLLSGGGSTPMINATAAQWVGMVNWFQNGSISSRLGIPMIYGIDAVHGHNNLYGATIFPHNIGLGATG